MTRDETLKEILEFKGNALLELPTGYGKSKMGIELIKSNKCKKVLIVVPKNVLKDNWAKELLKWKYTGEVTFTTYVSFPKYADKWDAVIFDEGHHLSQRCIDSLKGFEIKHVIILSATISREKRDIFSRIFSPLKCYKITIRKAIEDNVLPDPKVLLIPLKLNITDHNIILTLNKKNKGAAKRVPYSFKWKALKDKNTKYEVMCSQYQYYNELSSKIDWFKKKALGSRNIHIKNAWLRLCGERLKWLSSIKEEVIVKLLEKYKDRRTLTFCSSIEQTQRLGEHCINSKNGNSSEVLEKFNNEEIDHITAVDMLNEGMNLTKCDIGIYAILNSSEVLIKQKLGRILRAEEPLVIIPYYVNTREEEIVQKMIENYNKDLIIYGEISD